MVAVVIASGEAFAAEREQAARYFTAAEIDDSKAYSSPLYWKFAIDWVWTLVFTVLVLGLQLNRRLKVRCEAAAARLAPRLAGSKVLVRIGAALTRLWGDESWGGAILFVSSYLCLVTLIHLPEGFFFEWVYERAHGLSVEPLGRFFWDQLKGFLVTLLAISSLAFGLFGLARRRRDWWLLLGVPCGVLMLGAGLLDPYRTRLYFDYVPVPEGEVKQKIVAVLKKADVEYEGVYGLKVNDVTKRTNAYIVGEGPTRRIVLFDTLVEAMTADEVANAVAHEIGHLRDKSPGRPLVASVVLLPYLWLMALFMRRLGRSGKLGFDGDRDVASLPAAFFFVWLVNSASAPVSSAYSRHLEYRADEYALTLLKDPATFRSMMVKLARTNRGDPLPPDWAVFMVASHPPVLARIENIERFAAEHGIALAAPTPELFLTKGTSVDFTKPKPPAIATP